MALPFILSLILALILALALRWSMTPTPTSGVHHMFAFTVSRIRIHGPLALAFMVPRAHFHSDMLAASLHGEMCLPALLGHSYLLLYPNLFRAQAATLTKLRGAQKRARPLPAATLPGHSGLSPECRIRARLWIFSTEASQILAGTLVKSGGARQPA
ncbi:hypothetical protein DFH94DRAFT_686909 [Russula ochroleuca]|uniref:Uncharacterized protein n=1 Tax=Russula ochroleuca TaxID=152965 RepID=A0A9P5MPR9_9AGAM|nr:hypothetical protein DFH94DRAFT_686909 [Russula ochroleuca]